MQKQRDEKVVCPSPYAGVWLIAQNAKMFGPNSMYQNLNINFDPATAPHGTFKSLTVEDIAIIVEEGASTPGMCIYSEPGSTFGKTTISNITLNGQCFPLVVPKK